MCVVVSAPDLAGLIVDVVDPLDELVERSKTDPAAPFEPEQLRLLASLERDNLHAFTKAWTGLKRARVPMRRLRKALDDRGRDERGRDVAGTRPDFAGAPDDIREHRDSQSPYLQTAGWLLANRKGRLWYDEFHNNYFADWDGTRDERGRDAKPIDDAWALNLHATIHLEDPRLAKSGVGNTENAIHYVGRQDVRNQPQEWITKLEWDGVPRLPTWLSKAYGVPEDKYHADVGRCWLVSIAARIMRPGCKVDTMPVLIGPQGTAKSTSLEVLGGDWYVAENVSAEKPQDFLAVLAGKIAELPEMDAINSQRVSKQRIKALLSTAVDEYRPPYGRVAKKFKRTAVFAGTTNEIDWHSDETGGRRFWPIACQGQIDLEWIRSNRDQLFAEALHRFKAGEKWWDVDRGDQERRLSDHMLEDPLVEPIRDWLFTLPQPYLGTLFPHTAARPGDPTAHDEDSRWGNLITTNRIMTSVMQLPRER
jgi:virulence-associated protein E